MKVETFKHDGKSYELTLVGDGGHAGEFAVVIDGDAYYSETLKGLKDKIGRMMRKASVRVSLPAVRTRNSSRWKPDEKGETEAVTITGIHQRNRSILLRVNATGKAATADGYEGELLKPSVNVKEYKRLVLARAEANKAYDAFVETWSYDKKDIEAEIGKAERAAGIEPDWDEE
jgi:hypothetical protein